jgi:hypothetical protein
VRALLREERDVWSSAWTNIWNCARLPGLRKNEEGLQGILLMENEHLASIPWLYCSMLCGVNLSILLDIPSSVCLANIIEPRTNSIACSKDECMVSNIYDHRGLECPLRRGVKCNANPTLLVIPPLRNHTVHRTSRWPQSRSRDSLQLHISRAL